MTPEFQRKLDRLDHLSRHAARTFHPPGTTAGLNAFCFPGLVVALQSGSDISETEYKKFAEDWQEHLEHCKHIVERIQLARGLNGQPGDLPRQEWLNLQQDPWIGKVYLVCSAHGETLPDTVHRLALHRCTVTRNLLETMRSEKRRQQQYLDEETEQLSQQFNALHPEISP
ncbi:hypothetical protein [Deinococcus cellulosilyticus]|uniref:Uncharacterized protein n=1 Tax=Deinococcus cellulosilyticus (strain DSM 18568 / NBRC 106333 / KACC 11606 / 5516J-15) TaxID=1223518 RepID=A0A511NB76_DEIC1|nr:hypothetical protein [Deinococcus cellulosilyticus]GEM50052.1 hypothetical protein DC3_56870 [Deinococcus cellulosilyticus NBRC 106333 = KACC 11606]